MFEENFLNLQQNKISMAEAKKGKKTGKPKKGSKPKKKSNKKVSLNFFSKIMLTLLLIAVIACAIFLTLSNFNNREKKIKVTPKQEVSIKQDDKTKKNDKEVKSEVKKEDKKETKTEVKKETPTEKKTEVKKEESKLPEEKPKKEFKELKTLNGCWLSSEQGASLTIDDYGYRIDFFGVDASKPITGNYSIENNLIVFSSDSSDCNGVDGSYRITFYKKNISLICKDDKCSSRRNILEADWEWIEI